MAETKLSAIFYAQGRAGKLAAKAARASRGAYKRKGKMISASEIVCEKEMFIMRKVKYGLLAGMVAATILALTACGNNQDDSNTTTPTAKNTSTAPSENNGNNRETDSTNGNNATTNSIDNGGGVLDEIGNGIEDGIEDIEDGMDEIGSDRNDGGTGDGAGTSTGTR